MDETMEAVAGETVEEEYGDGQITDGQSVSAGQGVFGRSAAEDMNFNRAFDP